MDAPKITYYKLFADDGRAAGLVRRIHLSPYPRDESLRRNLTWHPTQFLRKSALGDIDNDYQEISAEEAGELIEYWRVKWSREDNPESH